MPKLTAFNLSSLPEPEEGRHDKVELVVGSWTLEGSKQQVDAFKRALASDQGIESVPSHGAVRWFAKPSTQGRSSWELKTRTGEVEVGSALRPRLLFAASAKFSTGPWQGRSAPRTTSVSLRLYLNLTRLMRHQDSSLADVLQESWGVGSSEVRLVARNLRSRAEYSLDGRDNWLPNTDFWQGVSRADCAFASSQLYVDAILSAWESEAERAAELSGVGFTPNPAPNFNLQKVETYWEFKATDPTGVVRMLTYPLERFTAMSSVQEFPLKQEMDGNSRSLLVRLRMGEFLRVYAKTNRRIRFEVEYKLSGKGDAFVQFETHTGPDIDELLDDARGLACETVSGCFSYLARTHNTDGDDVPPFRLIFDLIEGSASPSVAYEILSLLVHNGRIVSRFTPRLAASLKVLKRMGVLVVERRFNYVAAAKYERGLERLRKEASRFPLSGS